MPIHDFQCRQCAHRFEQLVKPEESADCPACGAAHAEKLFSCSAAVSTRRTREKSLAVVRGKAKAVKREKDHAHSEYLSQHAKDHS